MKVLAFAIGIVILTIGVLGMIAPSLLISIGQLFVVPAAWYVLAVVRVAIGVLLLVVANSSRVPRALRVVAFVPLLAGLAIPFVGVSRAQEMVERWSLQESWLIRLSALPVIALGGFVAYACAPSRRAA